MKLRHKENSALKEHFIRLTADRQSKQGYVWGSKHVNVDNWSVVIAEHISMEELSNACRNLHLTVPKNPDMDQLKTKLEKFLKEKHPIRTFIKDLEDHENSGDFYEMAYYLALKKTLSYNQMRTFKQQAKVIADFCIDTKL